MELIITADKKPFDCCVDLYLFLALSAVGGVVLEWYLDVFIFNSILSPVLASNLSYPGLYSHCFFFSDEKQI